MSLAMNMEPMKVMQTSAVVTLRRLEKRRTIRWARIVKKRMLRRAQTTANVENRQVRVFQSK